MGTRKEERLEESARGRWLKQPANGWRGEPLQLGGLGGWLSRARGEGEGAASSVGGMGGCWASWLGGEAPR
ncbi:hypothetical protein Dimus_020294, partial [Dionaea muscipula]